MALLDGLLDGHNQRLTHCHNIPTVVSLCLVMKGGAGLLTMQLSLGAQGGSMGATCVKYGESKHRRFNNKLATIQVGTDGEYFQS